MRKISLTIVVLLGLTLGAGVPALAGEATGPPTPVPYKAIPDPADNAVRHIVVKSVDRGPVWSLIGYMNDANTGIDFARIKALRPHHWRNSLWPFWYPISISEEARRSGRRQWGDRRDSAASIGKGLDQIRELQKTGMTWQLILHHLGPFRGVWGVKADDEVKLKAYYDHIYTLVKYCRHMGLPVDYWELQNEPPTHNHTSDNPGGYTFKGSWQDYLASWDAGYNAVRAADPEAKLVGPSFGGVGGDEDVTKAIDIFLAHCKEKGQRLEVLAWHFPSYVRKKDQDFVSAGAGTQLAPDRAHMAIEEVRKLVETKYPDLGVERFQIDESGAQNAITGPGTQIALFYYFDLAGVASCGRYVNTSGDLNGLLIGPKTPRHLYWAWKVYADGVGKRLVTETDDRCVVAIASRDDKERVVRAVVARSKRHTGTPDSPAVNTKVDFEGLPVEGDVEVSILRLGPGIGVLWDEDLEGLTTRNVETVQDGKLTLMLDKVQENQVYSITIAPVGTRAKQEAAEQEKQRLKELAEKEKQLPKESEKQMHFEGMAKAAKAAATGVIRIACGADLAFTDPAGAGWFADRNYEEGGFGHVDGGTVYRAIAIEGTDNPELYRSELWGQKSYHITLANGKHLIRLHWAETYGANRKFDVTIEGETVLKDLNPLGEAGARNKAFFREFAVEVKDGVLDIEFPHEGSTPMINAIEAIRK